MVSTDLDTLVGPVRCQHNLLRLKNQKVAKPGAVLVLPELARNRPKFDGSPGHVDVSMVARVRERARLGGNCGTLGRTFGRGTRGHHGGRFVPGGGEVQ